MLYPFILCFAVACGDPPMDHAEKAQKTSPLGQPGEVEGLAGGGESVPERLPLSAIGLKSEETGDVWLTEDLTEAANGQLARVKGFILGKVPAEGVDAVGVSDFSHAVLRPETLKTVFEEGGLRVRKPVTDLPETRMKGSLAEALSRLSAPYEVEGRQVKMKIFEVENPGDEFRTKIKMTLAGRVGEGYEEESATWMVGWVPGDPPRIKSIEVLDYRSSRADTPGGGRLFEDCTEAVLAGVPAYDEQFAFGADHWAARIEAAFGVNVSGWEGLALGDANGDGLEDVYVCQPGGLPNRLLIQKPDGTVFDASSFSGVDWRLQTQSALFVDFDNDGDQDLAIATTIGILFMANDGRGTFTEKASELIPESAPLGLAAADFDLDGDLDVYACCYSKRRQELNSTILGRPMPYHDANNGGRNVLFRNDRDWTFTQATVETGLDANNRRFSFSASWEDYDNDGDADLYVANDYGRNNLYRNDRNAEGEHVFVDVAREAGVEDISAGMSVSWGDFDQDRDMDLYVSNMWSSAGNRVSYQRRFQEGAGDQALADLRRHARGNSLFENEGDGTFRDVSVEKGVTMGRWAWGSRFIDLNTDGFEDLYVANGFITRPDDTGDL
ncbi:MAG: VCBS repeat-containing protein [Verrucomicrobiota bacterium]